MTAQQGKTGQTLAGSRRASTAVLALGALLTLALAGLWIYETRLRDDAAVARSAETFEASLASRIFDVERTLLGFAGFMATSDTVTPRDFAEYHRLVLGEWGSPSWRAVGYAPETTRDSLSRLLREVDEGWPIFADAGYPPFAISPDHDGSALFPMLLVEPRDARPGVFGFNLASSPERLAAIRRSVASRGVAVTEPVRLSQDGTGAPESLLLVAAVEHLRTATFPSIERGVAAAGFTPGPLLSTLLDRQSGPPARVRLSRGTAVFEVSGNVESTVPSDLFARWIAAPSRAIYIGGAPFTLDYSELRGQTTIDIATLTAILLLGLTATGFAFAFTRRVETTSDTIAAELGRRSDALQRAERLAAEDRRVTALGRLVGGVAHDFNNLLTVIIGNLDTLSEEPNHPERDVIAAETIEAANRGAEVTRRLLSYGGQAALRPRPVPVNDALEQAAYVARRIAPSTISVVNDPAPRPLIVAADPAALAGALLDLIVNACSAMPDGGTLTLAARSVDDAPDGATPAPSVAITVSDTGAGVAPADREAIFEPFFTTRPVGAGSGLGLASVMGFARQSGGTVWVEAPPAGGARFVLTLPLCEDVAAEADEAGAAAVPGGLVLLVEDDELVRHTVASQLRRLGHVVTTATDAQAALDLLADGMNPDLLVTDIVMPGGISGAELARRLRRRRPELPVLFISGYPRSDLTGGHEVPEDAPMLMKPFRVEDLRAFLKRHLSQTGKANLRRGEHGPTPDPIRRDD